MATTEPLIRIAGLVKTFGPVRALDGVDLELAGGQVVGLMGENGCGKTTLMKILAGLTADYTGEVRIAGHAPGAMTKAAVSFLPDVSFLPSAVRPRECIRMYRDFFADFDPERAHRFMELFGLDESRRLKEMSKGMREKVQIAMTMSRQAKVYLLDEPISGVDPAARQVVLDAVIRNLDGDATLLVSTHLIHDLEPILDRVVMMRGGRILLNGQVDDLRAEHHSSIDQLFREVYR